MHSKGQPLCSPDAERNRPPARSDPNCTSTTNRSTNRNQSMLSDTRWTPISTSTVSGSGSTFQEDAERMSKVMRMSDSGRHSSVLTQPYPNTFQYRADFSKLSQGDRYEPKREALRKLLLTEGPWDHDLGGLCKQHRNLDFAHVILNPGPEGSIDMGFLCDIFARATKCTMCRLIRFTVGSNVKSELLLRGAWASCAMIAIKYDYAEENNYEYIDSSKANPLRQVRRLSILLEKASLEFKHPSPPLFLHILAGGTSKSKILQSPLYQTLPGRVLNPKTGLERVNNWLHRCGASHHKCRQGDTFRYGRQMNWKSLRVVDVHRRKVVSVAQSVQYIALSYVWGSDDNQTFKSKNSNSKDRSGNLVDLDLPGQLPASIEDAIQATMQLGVPYLWVDVLCIVQDDKDHKELQISQMHKIYSAAFVTLAAAGGDNASCPIPGVRPNSRLVRQREARLGSEVLGNTLPLCRDAIASSVWNTRAWTFQERVLSRRVVIFTEFQTYWQCIEEPWIEDTSAEHLKAESPGSMKNKFSKIHEPLSDTFTEDDLYEFYTFVVNEYTSRDLGVSKDVLKAFNGTVQAFEDKTRTQFCTALPTKRLCCTLLWYPTRPCSRRLDIELPTWSWASWKGPVRYAAQDFEAGSMKPEMIWYNRFTRRVGKSDVWKFYRTVRNVVDEHTTKDGALRLWTRSSRFRIKHVNESINSEVDSGKHYQSNTIRKVLVLDKAGKESGEVILDTLDPSCQDGCKEFILISLAKSFERKIWSEGWGGRSRETWVTRGIPTTTTGEGLVTTRLPAQHGSWCFYRVLMVERRGSECKRIAVGTIHIDAWEAQGSNLEFIRLV